MENTYTYTARNAEHPELVVTFTLHDHKMSIGVGAPVEQLERVVAGITAEDGEAPAANVWLKPLALSLIERGTGPFDIRDIDASVDGDHLMVRGWVRLAGLRGGVVTLMEGRVDNPDAAVAFVDQLHSRKEGVVKPVLPMDYWVTWLGILTSLIAFFVFWRRRASRGPRWETPVEEGEAIEEVDEE